MQNSTSHIGLPFAAEHFTDPAAAVERVHEIYNANTAYLRDCFKRFSLARTFSSASMPATPSCASTPTRYAGGHEAVLWLRGGARHLRDDADAARPVRRTTTSSSSACCCATTASPLEVGTSTQPIPVHFVVRRARPHRRHADAGAAALMRDMFDLPDLARWTTASPTAPSSRRPASRSRWRCSPPPRVDYSLHRLRHYTGTAPEHFQNFVLFTNYQFYIDEFVRLGMKSWPTDDPSAGYASYTAFVEPGNVVTRRTGTCGASRRRPGAAPPRLPQMPAYHLMRPTACGITMVNIGVGPSNAKTITDHIAVLRPHAWMMLGHCAGLRNTQQLGDYVLAHGYVREDHVLDDDLPLWVPIPPLAEVQVALEEAVADVTGLPGYELKRIMRTGTVATTDNRNWELRRPHASRCSASARAAPIALDMESATIAANGFRFRVPYGTLLCVSRQAAARRAQAARHGQPLLPRAGRPAPAASACARWSSCASNGRRTAAQPQAAQLRRGGVPVNRAAVLVTMTQAAAEAPPELQPAEPWGCKGPAARQAVPAVPSVAGRDSSTRRIRCGSATAASPSRNRC